MKKFAKVIGLGVLFLLLLGAIGFTIWASSPAAPERQALSSLSSSEDVRFENLDGWLVFTPAGQNPETGLILYPGGRVDYRAYASHARSIASAGYTVVVVPMPLNFAFLGVNRASDVIEAFPGIETWAVGGHSLGGAMAAQFASANPTLVDGLVLWAAYSAEGTDLSNSGIEVISIYASNDGLATQQEIAESKTRLPGDTIYVEISGGNHAGFGWYGEQPGDGESLITKADQQAQVVDATAVFLETISN